jgi:diguanylate cyclase (GGDEF)-like protein/PAS domain S-box-containing protein
MFRWRSGGEKVLAFLKRLSGGEKTRRASTARLDRSNLLKRIAPSVIIVTIQVVLAVVSLRAASHVRAYIGAESLWSKEQKNAVYLLHRYAENRTSKEFEQFHLALSVPLGDMEARRALEKTPPDYEAAARGFAIAGIHPDDIPGMIRLFVYFRGLPFMARAVAIWRESDAPLMELSALGESIHRQVENSVSPDQLTAAEARINQLDQRLSPLALQFSNELGAGSRLMTIRLTLLNVATAIALTLLILMHTRNLVRQRQNFEKALRDEKEEAQVTLQSIGDAVVRIDAAGRVAYLNPAAERLMGVTQDQVQGRRLTSFISILCTTTGREQLNLIDRVLAAGEKTSTTACEFLLLTAGGTTPISLLATPLQTDGAPAGAVFVLRDMTQERELITRLSWQASHDDLTGLGNRRAFETWVSDRLDGLAISQSENALMLLDLDQFKLTNDTGGHAAGDHLLREVSALLTSVLRPGDLAARFGGDEFAVLLEDCDAARAETIAEQLRSAIEHSTFFWSGRPYKTSASIGLVMISASDTSVEDILRAADVACYLAKEKGRNRIQIHQFQDAETLQRLGEMAWIQKIRDALEENRFCLYGQNIASLHSDETGEHFEILIRLRDEQGTIVPPGSFIPAAERFGLMPLLDRWVVSATFTSLRALATSPEAIEIASCAINLSGLSIGDPNFVGFVLDSFRAHAIPPSMICFEITETAAIDNLDAAARFIQTLKQLGCRFALDDFGAGMSSFGYLKSLPVDYLKIDGSFVKDMLIDPIDRAMVEMIVRMAKTTGKKTIAEFVESNEILAELRVIGVDYAQGYAIATPEPLCDLFARTNARRLSETSPRPARASKQARAAASAKGGSKSFSHPS